MVGMVASTVDRIVQSVVATTLDRVVPVTVTAILDRTVGRHPHHHRRDPAGTVAAILSRGRGVTGGKESDRGVCVGGSHGRSRGQ